MLFLSRVLKPFILFFTGLDRLLVYLATPFGVRITAPRRRYAVLLGIYTAIYVLGSLPIPVLPLLALAVGYVGILAIGRAWVLNEKERTLIAKKLKDGNPDEMPDLRWTALVSALQLMILWPLIFMQVQWHFALYTVPNGANFWTWTFFTLDSYNKAFLGLLQVYGIQFEGVGLSSAWGRHLVTLCRLTFDFLLLQGIFRLLAIGQTIKEAVQAVKIDTDMSVRLGSRAVRRLIYALRDADISVRQGAITALGKLNDPRAIEPLTNALLQDPSEQVRCDAASALGELKDTRAVEPLIKSLLQDQEESVNWKAVEALGRLNDQRSVEPIIAVLGRCPNKNNSALCTMLHREAANSLGKLNDLRAVQPLITALQDAGAGDWRSSVAAALGVLKDTRAVEPLINILLHDEDASTRGWAANSLGKLNDLRAVEPLITALHHTDCWMRSEVVGALGVLKDTRAVEPLINILLHDKEDVLQRDSAFALGQLNDLLAVEPLLKVFQDPARVEFVRQSAGGALVRAVEPLIVALQDTDDVVRQKAALALGGVRDQRAVEPLITALRDSDAVVRWYAAWALGQLNDPRAVDPLITALQDTDERVRADATEALKRLDPVAAEKAELK